MEERAISGKMTNAREELKKIPALCRVLVEYEKTRSNKIAREMWEILLNAILAKLPELVEIDEEKIQETINKILVKPHHLVDAIASAKPIRIREGK